MLYYLEAFSITTTDPQQIFFITFSNWRRERKDSRILLGVKKQSIEPLRDYLSHFSLVAQGVNNLLHPAVVMAL